MREQSIRQVATLAGATPTASDGRAGPDVVIDSRLATPGTVFVALPGVHADGHDFIAAAASAHVLRRNGATPASGKSGTVRPAACARSARSEYSSITAVAPPEM